MSFLTNNAATGALVVDTNNTANNAILDVPRANAKALGFAGEGILAPNDTTLDATVSFSSNYAWDFDRSNGITSGTCDFVGVAIHELGHAMGFVSGVDTVDVVSAPNRAAQFLGTNLDPTGCSPFLISTGAGPAMAAASILPPVAPEPIILIFPRRWGHIARYLRHGAVQRRQPAGEPLERQSRPRDSRSHVCSG